MQIGKRVERAAMKRWKIWHRRLHRKELRLRQLRAKGADLKSPAYHKKAPEFMTQGLLILGYQLLADEEVGWAELAWVNADDGDRRVRAEGDDGVTVHVAHARS